MWPQFSPGILGARPGMPPFPGTAHANFAGASQPGYSSGAPGSGYGFGSGVPGSGYGSGAPATDPTASWNQAALASALNTMTLQQPEANWYMDSGASSHLSSSSGNLSSIHNPSNSHSNIIVGNGSYLPISCSGYTSFPNPTRPLHLSNVLVSPHLITNLISVHKFTKDNHCSVELIFLVYM